MAQLIWTGTDEQEQYHDDERNITYWPSERPVDVPEPTAAEYLEHEGWEEVEDPDEDLTEQVLDEHDRAKEQTDGTDEAGEEFTTMPASEPEDVIDHAEQREVAGGDENTDDLGDVDDQFLVEDEHTAEASDDDASVSESETEEPESEAESEAERDIAQESTDNGEFDADQFVDNNWRSVASEIRKGSVDDRLDEIERAERNRSGGGRENSVLSAIEDRREGQSPDAE